MSHIWINHGTHIDGTSHTHICVTLHAEYSSRTKDELCQAYEYVHLCTLCFNALYDEYVFAYDEYVFAYECEGLCNNYECKTRVQWCLMIQWN